MAGTTIGAGCWQCRWQRVGVGFSVTLWGLLIGPVGAMCWRTALLLLEVYQHVPADTGLGLLAKRYLGRYDSGLRGPVRMMRPTYALTAAYISGAGELLASSINNWLGATLARRRGAAVHLCCRWWCVGTSLVDLFNRFLFSAKDHFSGHHACGKLLTPHIHKVNLLRFLYSRGWRYPPYRSFSPRLASRKYRVL